MNHARRTFLADVGKGMLVSTLGTSLTVALGMESAVASTDSQRLEFGDLEPLVDLMQNTPVDRLQPAIVAQAQAGVPLRRLAAAAALANARAFGGQDYDGYHTFMALGPALSMAGELPESHRLLPLLKVFYRNTNRIQSSGSNASEVLKRIEVAKTSGVQPDGEMLRQATRGVDMQHAEELFAVLSKAPPNEAYNHLQLAIQDEVDVHRTVLAWRAWEMMEITGQEFAHTLLRQSVRYCVDNEQRRQSKGSLPSAVRDLLPQLVEEFGLHSKTPGQNRLSDQSLNDLTQVIFSADREQAARAVATALADDVSPASIGEALSLAANRLLLYDPGRPPNQASKDKPAGSVHGASVGVHAMDSSNAWRNIAGVSNRRNQIASLIVGAYHTAGQTNSLGPSPIPYKDAADKLHSKSSAELLSQLSESIRSNDQVLACAVVHALSRHESAADSVFATLLPFAVSEDGALHAEKFYRTVREEFVNSRPSQRWNHLIALARVTASEFGTPAPGREEALDLLGLV